MTMPSKIWCGYNNVGMSYFDESNGEFHGETPYIRADIAEDLARALENEVNRSRRHLSQSTLAALTRYNALTH